MPGKCKHLGGNLGSIDDARYPSEDALATTDSIIELISAGLDDKIVRFRLQDKRELIAFLIDEHIPDERLQARRPEEKVFLTHAEFTIIKARMERGTVLNDEHVAALLPVRTREMLARDARGDK